MTTTNYGLIRTIQVRNENTPGVLGSLATTIGGIGANIGNIQTVSINQNFVLRDIDVFVEEHRDAPGLAVEERRWLEAMSRDWFGVFELLRGDPAPSAQRHSATAPSDQRPSQPLAGRGAPSKNGGP